MKNDNDLTVSLAQALQDMKMEQGNDFDVAKANLAELERRTGISRAKLRRLKSNDFKEMPHALTGLLIYNKSSQKFASGIPVFLHMNSREFANE